MCPQWLDREKTDSRIRANQRELNPFGLEEWKIVLCKIRDAGVERITLTGGEPLLVPFLPDLIRYASELKFIEIHMQTNMTLMTAAIASVIVEYGVKVVGVSIDGPRDVHDKIRGRPGAFDDMIRGMHLILAEKKKSGNKKPELFINCTMSALNYRTIEAIPGIAAELGVDFQIGMLQYFSGYHNSVGKGLATKGEERILPESLHRIDIGEMKRSLERLRSAAKRLNLPVRTCPSIASDKEIIRWYTDPKYSYTTKCLAPWDFLNVDPFGRLIMCMIGDCTGNLLVDSVEGALNNEEYRAFRRRLRHCGLFPGCTHCCLLTNRAWATVGFLKEKNES